MSPVNAIPWGEVENDCKVFRVRVPVGSHDGRQTIRVYVSPTEHGLQTIITHGMHGTRRPGFNRGQSQKALN